MLMPDYDGELDGFDKPRPFQEAGNGLVPIPLHHETVK